MAYSSLPIGPDLAQFSSLPGSSLEPLDLLVPECVVCP